MGVQLMAQTAEIISCQNRKYSLVGSKCFESIGQTRNEYVYYGFKNDTLFITRTSYNKEQVLYTVTLQKLALIDFAASSYTDGLGVVQYKKGSYNISWASDSSYCNVNINIGTREKKAIRISDSGCSLSINMPPSGAYENQVYVSFPNAAKAEAFLAELQAKSKKFEKK